MPLWKAFAYACVTLVGLSLLFVVIAVVGWWLASMPVLPRIIVVTMIFLVLITGIIYFMFNDSKSSES